MIKSSCYVLPKKGKNENTKNSQNQIPQTAPTKGYLNFPHLQNRNPIYGDRGAMGPTPQKGESINPERSSNQPLATFSFDVSIHAADTSLTRFISGILSARSEGVESHIESRTPIQHRKCSEPFSSDETNALINEYERKAEKRGYTIQQNEGFIWFESVNFSSSSFHKKCGVKFHISLAHEPDNYVHGTLAVLETLFQFKCLHFKIVHPASLSNKEAYDEGGREVTIYTYMYEEKPFENHTFSLHWSTLIKTIAHRLSLQEIMPHIDANERIIPPKKDTIILFSNDFVTWRDDSSLPSFKDHAKPKHPIVPMYPRTKPLEFDVDHTPQLTIRSQACGLEDSDVWLHTAFNFTIFRRPSKDAREVQKMELSNSSNLCDSLLN